MRKLFFLLVLAPSLVTAQKLKKADKQVLEALQTHIYFLADDKLEGRRAGTAGEALAVQYIIAEFTRAGLSPKGENGFMQPFSIDEGRAIKSTSVFQVDGKDMVTGVDYYPLAYSPDTKLIQSATSVSVRERGTPWFLNLAEGIIPNKDNPHFDLEAWTRSQIANATEKGATALILYNTVDGTEEPRFNGRDKSAKATLPVIYVTRNAFSRFLGDPEATYDLKILAETEPRTRTAHNVVGYIDNGAAQTIVLGAHLDHLGYGEDGNSMIRTGEKTIHNGADDNASGTAALIELAKRLRQSRLKKHNYLFIAFSGEELGLYGSKYFVEHPTIPLNSISYMVNMDMVGRMNDSSRVVTIGGYGTSPTWGNLIGTNEKKSAFSVKIDSSGTGPSDHTSFYRKDIPVLFFFTGLHTDYHKPSDDAEKINYKGTLFIVKYIYELVNTTNDLPKLAFTKTREQQVGSSTRFTVSMGIMPDYTFSGAGVRVDGVSEGKAAQRAGLKAGDIVTQLGDHAVTSVEGYMQALGKFKKGEATRVKVKRGSEEMVFDISF
jgi:Zn-dependent M28 family amino/carboxypeptidase